MDFSFVVWRGSFSDWIKGNPKLMPPFGGVQCYYTHARLVAQLHQCSVGCAGLSCKSRSRRQQCICCAHVQAIICTNFWHICSVLCCAEAVWQKQEIKTRLGASLGKPKLVPVTTLRCPFRTACCYQETKQTQQSPLEACAAVSTATSRRNVSLQASAEATRGPAEVCEVW